MVAARRGPNPRRRARRAAARQVGAAARAVRQAAAVARQLYGEVASARRRLPEARGGGLALDTDGLTFGEAVELLLLCACWRCPPPRRAAGPHNKLAARAALRVRAASRGVANARAWHWALAESGMRI